MSDCQSFIKAPGAAWFTFYTLKPPIYQISMFLKWQPTWVLLPGEVHGWRSLVGYSPWGRKESDTTERLHFHFHIFSYSVVPSFSKSQVLTDLYFIFILVHELPSLVDSVIYNDQLSSIISNTTGTLWLEVWLNQNMQNLQWLSIVQIQGFFPPQYFRISVYYSYRILIGLYRESHLEKYRNPMFPWVMGCYGVYWEEITGTLPAHAIASVVWLFVTLWTVAHQDPLSMGILQARILKRVAMGS